MYIVIYWMFCPLKFICWILILMWWYLEVGPLRSYLLGHEGFMALVPLWKESRELACFLSPMWGWEVGHNPDEGPYQNLPMLAPWSQISSLLNCEKSISVVDKSPSLRYIVTAVWTKMYMVISNLYFLHY